MAGVGPGRARAGVESKERLCLWGVSGSGSSREWCDAPSTLGVVESASQLREFGGESRSVSLNQSMISGKGQSSPTRANIFRFALAGCRFRGMHI